MTTENILFTSIRLDELEELIYNSVKRLFLNYNQHKQIEEQKIYTVNEACEFLSITKQTLYKLVRERNIPCYKRGKRLYFMRDELIGWIRHGKKKTIKELEEEAHTYIKQQS